MPRQTIHRGRVGFALGLALASSTRDNYSSHVSASSSMIARILTRSCSASTMPHFCARFETKVPPIPPKNRQREFSVETSPGARLPSSPGKTAVHPSHAPPPPLPSLTKSPLFAQERSQEATSGYPGPTPTALALCPELATAPRLHTRWNHRRRHWEGF